MGYLYLFYREHCYRNPHEPSGQRKRYTTAGTGRDRRDIPFCRHRGDKSYLIRRFLVSFFHTVLLQCHKLRVLSTEVEEMLQLKHETDRSVSVKSRRSRVGSIYCLITATGADATRPRDVGAARIL